MNKLRLLLPIGFFAVLIFGLFSHVLAPDNMLSNTENRVLQKAPLNPSTKELLSGEWSSQVETYFSDQFPVRDVWLKTFVQSEMLMGKTYINEKYFFDEESGWITTKPADLQPAKKLSDITDKVVGINKEIEALGIGFTFFSLPAKATYVREPHPEYMPEDSGIQNNRKFLDLLTEKKVDNVRVMDTMQEQNGGKLNYHDLYFKTDHHWNINGSFTGYQAIMTDLSERMGKPIIPLTVENTRYDCLDNDLAGSWNKFFHMTIQSDDKICYRDSERFEEQFTVFAGPIANNKGVNYSAVYATGKNIAANQTVNYSQGYSSDFAEMNIINKQYDIDGHLIVIKDSYFNPIQFHVASHFKRTTVIDLRYFEEDIVEYVRTLHPSYVIMTYNDRNFDLGM